MNPFDAAGDWVARRYGGLSPEEDIEFGRWLAEDPRRAAAIAECEAAWLRMRQPLLAGQTEVLRRGLADRRRRRLRRMAYAAGSAACAAVLVAVVWLQHRAPSASAPAQVVALHPDIRTLSDGSTVELNAGASIAVDFSPELRRVRLVRGEALFHVAKNAARPFIVSANDLAVRAVGTAFTVSYATAEINVLVTEGKVQVLSRVEGSPAVLVAGQRASVAFSSKSDPAPAIRVFPASPPEIEQQLAWRRMHVEFTDIPLKSAVELFNRQNRLQIAIAEPTLGERRISGIYWLVDPAGFVRLLKSGLSLKVEESPDRVTLRPE